MSLKHGFLFLFWQVDGSLELERSDMRCDDYDDSEELERYVEHNLNHLMNDAERREHNLAMRQVWSEIGELKHVDPEFYTTSQQETVHGVLLIISSLETSIRRRIESDIRAGTLAVNRCPDCGRIVLTPLAKQCLWCGFDWHGS